MSDKNNINKRKRLSAGTVPVNKKHLTGTVPVNKVHFLYFGGMKRKY